MALFPGWIGKTEGFRPGRLPAGKGGELGANAHNVIMRIEAARRAHLPTGRESGGPMQFGQTVQFGGTSLKWIRR